jgi:hypothetical protein
MRGMNQVTGRSIENVDHLCQSIHRVLTTPRGSRIARREFGSDLQELVDAPLNPVTRVRLFAASATALMRWEPRLKLTRIGLVIDFNAPGVAVLEVEGTTNISRELVSTTVPINLGGMAL